MANQLKMAMIETIWTLHRRGWSQRRIADALGINRETVARHLQRGEPPSKPASAPPGSAAVDDTSKPASAPPGSAADEDPVEPNEAPTGSTPGHPRPGPGRPSDCEPWRDRIQARCDRGLSAQRIYQDLVAEHGFTGSYYRFIRRKRALPGNPHQTGLSDQFVSALVDRQDLQLEELLVPEPVGLALHRLDLVVRPLHRAAA